MERHGGGMIQDDLADRSPESQRVLVACDGLARRTVPYGQQDASCAYLGTEDGSCKPRLKRCDS